MNYFDINQVTLSGTCCIKKEVQKCELRYTQSGTAVTQFPLAIDVWNSSKKEKESFIIQIVAWGKLAENIEMKLRSGMPVMVWGELRQETWVDNHSGEKRFKFVIWANGYKIGARGDDKGSGSSRAEPGGRWSGKSNVQPANEEYDIGDLGPPLDMDDSPLSPPDEAPRSKMFG